MEWNEVVNGSGIEEVHPLIEADLATRMAPGDGLEPVVWFRLDDDDILAVDYLARLESYRTLGSRRDGNFLRTGPDGLQG